MNTLTRRAGAALLIGILSGCSSQKNMEPSPPPQTANPVQEVATTRPSQEKPLTESVPPEEAPKQLKVAPPQDAALKKEASTQSKYASWPVKDHFITTWKLTESKYAIKGTEKLLVLPTGSASDDFDYDVDWDNDGVFDEIGVRGAIYHYYEEYGTYSVAIRGKFPHMEFMDTGGCELHMEGGDAGAFPEHFIASDSHRCNRYLLIAVAQWGAIKWESMHGMFRYAMQLKSFPQDHVPDTSRVTDMSYMFEGHVDLDLNLESWNVSSVKTMEHIFQSATLKEEPSWWIKRGRP